MILSKKIKHIIVCELIKNIKTKRQTIMDFTYGLTMELMEI